MTSTEHQHQSVHSRERRGLRVLICADFLPPMPGGLEKHAAGEALGLAQNGHAVRAVALSDGNSPPGESTLASTIPTLRVRGWRELTKGVAADPNRIFHPPLPDPGVVRQLRAEIKRFQPDVIHAHGWIAHSALAAAGSTPVLVTLHDQGAICPKRNLLTTCHEACSGPSLRRCLPCAGSHFGAPIGTAITLAMRTSSPRLNKAARILAVSHQVRDAVIANSMIDPDRVDVVSNFFDDAAMRAAAGRPRPAWMPAGPVVLAIGAVSRFKGAHLLADAWPQVIARSGANCPTLVFIGPRNDDGPAPLPDRCVAVGSRPSDEVMTALRHADVFTALSIGPDACPTTVMEAAAAGCPTVVTALGGAVDIIHDEVSGLVVPPNDPAMLSNAIIRLLQKGPSVTNMIDQAALNVAHRGRNSIIRQIEHIMYDVLRADRAPLESTFGVPACS